ncbi:MAG TPA: alpha/beta hydrolase [Planctomycetaceae bacterium]|nr:alpha/beta hydrolase [Planctomycetaceae bacterium]
MMLQTARTAFCQSSTRDVAAAVSHDTNRRLDVKIVRDIEYARVADQRLMLDLFLPEGPGAAENPPLLVWIHGGGWRGGSRAKPPIRRLTDAGIAIASISYRFTDVAIFPAQIHDCKGAIRWLRANAKLYGYDERRIAVGGSSAGGHLALLVGTTGGVEELEGTVGGNEQFSSSVLAIVDYFGPSDFVLRGRTQPEMAYSEKAGSFALLGGLEPKSAGVDKRLERIASPSNWVGKGDPPLLMLHGTKDTRVLIDQSERMLDLYKDFDLEAELIRVTGAGHGGMEFFMGKNFQTVQAFLSDSFAKLEK